MTEVIAAETNNRDLTNCFGQIDRRALKTLDEMPSAGATEGTNPNLLSASSDEAEAGS